MHISTRNKFLVHKLLIYLIYIKVNYCTSLYNPNLTPEATPSSQLNKSISGFLQHLHHQCRPAPLPPPLPLVSPHCHPPPSHGCQKQPPSNLHRLHNFRFSSTPIHPWLPETTTPSTTNSHPSTHHQQLHNSISPLIHPTDHHRAISETLMPLDRNRSTRDSGARGGDGDGDDGADGGCAVVVCAVGICYEIIEIVLKAYC
ncbi:hypothetical protein HanXRQr2_Chr03g0135811 [Helianthus annuus]|uniref:Uncharacterized protein n=1 Tax=Helianthus annuus TaxID=4232 RepID=A0A9K3NZ47_HELAN|nr:hypothetical protein HanXRQr2_Chr03g0135811 [Helianthus annuus]KAJ0945823.1 hypothetical protein HanPSC8_Chr03g0132361 [Helianthus annuus]